MDMIDRQRRPPVPDRGLYSFQNEHDACGVGLVANISGQASHAIVEKGMTVLKNLMHRGATGSDPETGDGAGLLLSIPDKFFRREMPTLKDVKLYGVGMFFDGVGAEDAIESIVKAEGGAVLGWREVTTDATKIGRVARESCPRIRQLFIGGDSFADRAAFERKLFVMRREMEKSIDGLYVCSLSSKSIVYKGLLLATQLENFYLDLHDPAFESPLALVHQRYSTNTFPTWRLAHPFRYLAHNGEINTLRGNLNNLATREPHLASPLFGDDIKKLLPLIAGGQSDSACLDNMFELLVAAGRSLDHAMLMLMPQAWGKNYYLSRDVRGFFEYHSR